MEEFDIRPADGMTSDERIRVWLDCTEALFRTKRNPDQIYGYGGFTKDNPMRYLLRSDLESVIIELFEARRTLDAIASWTRVTDNGPGAASVSMILNGVRSYIDRIESLDREAYRAEDE